MTAPSLLDELEGVVRDIEVAESWDCTGDLMRCLDGSGCECAVRGCDRPDVEGDAVNFIRVHHAEIAAALADARRLDFIERECVTIRCEATVDDDVYYEVVDYYMAEPQERVIGVGKTPRDAIDNAMHNSAREDGE